MLRINGELQPQETCRLSTPRSMIRCSSRSRTKSSAHRFDEEKELDFSFTIEGIARFRVNAALQRGTVTLAFRLVKEHIPSLQEIGLPDICGQLALKPRGLVLVTGPTGCGKSTTLAAMIDYLNERERRHVVSSKTLSSTSTATSCA